MSVDEILIEVGGIDGVLRINDALQNMPEEIMRIRRVLLELVELGKIVMAQSILETSTSEKATGETARSIEGYLAPSGPNDTSFEFSIGSRLRKAFFASQEISWSEINANVQVMPGRWRFIGARPPMPKHPFLEDTLYALYKALNEHLGDEMAEAFGSIQRDVDALEEVFRIP